MRILLRLFLRLGQKCNQNWHHTTLSWRLSGWQCCLWMELLERNSEWIEQKKGRIKNSMVFRVLCADKWERFEAASKMHFISTFKLWLFCCAMLSLQLCQLFGTLRTVARQALLFMGFSRQEYWCGLPFPPPWDLSNPGIKPALRLSPALAGGFFTSRTTWEDLWLFYNDIISLYILCTIFFFKWLLIC